MKYIKPLILESKQVGILYHYTPFTTLYKILSTNILKASNSWDEVPVICCTRNKYFHYDYGGSFVNTQSRLILDGDKLSHRYKIFPYTQDIESDFEDGEEVDFGNSWKGDPRKISKGLVEWEERIIGDVKDIDKYILEVNINPIILKRGIEEIGWIKKLCDKKGIKFDSY